MFAFLFNPVTKDIFFGIVRHLLGAAGIWLTTAHILQTNDPYLNPTNLMGSGMLLAAVAWSGLQKYSASKK